MIVIILRNNQNWHQYLESSSSEIFARTRNERVFIAQKEEEEEEEEKPKTALLLLRKREREFSPLRVFFFLYLFSCWLGKKCSLVRLRSIEMISS